jgi:two-component system, LytTR family, response regulator
MTINCIVIDDEPLALQQMETFISRIDYLKLLKKFNNGFEPIQFIKNNKVDLMFLDIHMDTFDGIQLLESLIVKPKVILTTAYDNYAITGYELSVSDYLLKPISFSRFAKACEKIYFELNENINVKQVSQNIENNNIPNFIFAKVGHVIHKINFDEILYIEGMKEYLTIKTINLKIIVLQSFSKMEEVLPKSNFIRVHRSYIVAIDKIVNIERNRIKISDVYIPIGDMYKRNFFNRINNSGII